MKLAILIPTLPDRRDKFDLLVNELIRQSIEAGWVYRRDVKIIYDVTPRKEMNIGEKRNALLFHKDFTAEYGAFFDDDDKPDPSYIRNIKEGIEKDVDCCSLRGVYTVNGNDPELFEHSIKYDGWRTNHTGIVRYERPPNHLNCIRRSIMQQFRFKEIEHGEDRMWSEEIQASGLIKTEHFIDEIIYNYDYIENK